MTYSITMAFVNGSLVLTVTLVFLNLQREHVHKTLPLTLVKHQTLKSHVLLVRNKYWVGSYLVNFTKEMYFSKPSESSHGAKGTHSVHEQSSGNLIQCMRHTEKVSTPPPPKKKVICSYKFRVLFESNLSKPTWSSSDTGAK